MAEFKIGDRVVLIAPDPDSGPEVGSKGTVAFVADDDDILVQWDTDDYDSGENHHGVENSWWVPPRVLGHMDLPFYLIGIIDGVETELNGQPTFETGTDAAALAKRLTAELGYKVQPRRRKSDDDSWRQRETQRIADGTYVWMPEGWDLQPIVDHYLHRSKDEPQMVAYTASPQAGVLDRQTRTTPGRYLAQFYPDLSQRERNRYIAMVDGASNVLFARTPDEIEAVYLGGVSSCMGHALSDYLSYMHPVRVYGDSDLQLAYLKDGNRITARALVWPEKKLIGRIYGDEARLSRGLEDIGYKWGPQLHGARIRKLWDNQRNQYIVPYIDNCGFAWDPDPEDKEGFLVIQSSGNVYAGNTNGLGLSYQRCAKSGRWCAPADLRFVHGANEHWQLYACSGWREIEFKDRAGVRHREIWADEFLVEIGDDWFPKSLIKPEDIVRSTMSGAKGLKWMMVEMGDGAILTEHEAINHTLVCAGTNKRVWKRHTTYVPRMRAYYSNTYLDAHPELLKGRVKEPSAAMRPFVTVGECLSATSNS